MHGRFFIFLSLILVLSTTHVYAAPSYMKSKSNKVSLWNKVTDSFATIGKDSSEKQRIKRVRQAERQKTRLSKARTKASKKRLVELGIIDDKKWWSF